PAYRDSQQQSVQVISSQTLSLTPGSRLAMRFTRPAGREARRTASLTRRLNVPTLRGKRLNRPQRIMTRFPPGSRRSPEGGTQCHTTSHRGISRIATEERKQPFLLRPE